MSITEQDYLITSLETQERFFFWQYVQHQKKNNNNDDKTSSEGDEEQEKEPDELDRTKHTIEKAVKKLEELEAQIGFSKDNISKSEAEINQKNTISEEAEKDMLEKTRNELGKTIQKLKELEEHMLEIGFSHEYIDTVHRILDNVLKQDEKLKLRQEIYE